MQELANRYIYSNGDLISKVTGNVSGVRNNWGYLRVSWDRGKLGRIREYNHRLIWYMHNGDIPDGWMVDHINLDKTDNRIENLRLITKSGNAQNPKHKGYWYNTNARAYYAAIKVDGVVQFLGSYDTEVAARQAYLDAKVIYHPYASKHVLI